MRLSEGSSDVCSSDLDNLADLSTSFIATRKSFSGDLTGCAFGAQSGGVCFNDVLQSISAANFRHRGVAAQLTSGSGFWNYGVALGYSRRQFIEPETGILALVGGARDENYDLNMFVGGGVAEKYGCKARQGWM